VLIAVGRKLKSRIRDSGFRKPSPVGAVTSKVKGRESGDKRLIADG
jgi:hypothetical protein